MSVLKVNIQTLLISDINLSYSSENMHFSLSAHSNITIGKSSKLSLSHKPVMTQFNVNSA